MPIALRIQALVAFAMVLSSAVFAETIGIDANANRHAIDPRVYGVAFAGSADLSDLNAPLNRQGGNGMTRYNWQQNASNHAADWYFESIAEASSVAGESGDTFISNSKTGGAQPMLTIPMIGWVAKVGANRSKLASFSQAKYGAQTDADWQWYSDAGNGILQSNNQNVVNDPNDANVPADSTFQNDWVQHLIAKWGSSSGGGLKYYILDNEHSIWQGTHRDVHPTGATMDEIKTKMVDYATTIKAADPGAIVVGPEEWGWSGYLYSGYDQQYGAKHGWGTLPDRVNHGNKDYMPWLLDQMKQADTAAGKRLLDVFSLHYYPQSGEYGNDTSSAMQLTRNKSTRSLWDPNYTDVSWIGSVVQLIPRMKGWVANAYPGTLTGITEYNWGAESHINGATTQADIYGIFGREGLDIGTRWTTPDPSTPTYKAMKMYRNYDGNKSTFGDTNVKATVTNPDNIASFASVRSSDGAMTVMVINKITSSASVTLNLANFSAGATAQAWQLTSANAISRLADVAVSTNSLTLSVPAQSITLFVIPASTGGTKPAAPSNLAATAVSSTQINLAWTDNANNESGFKIERKTGAGGVYAQIGTVGADVKMYNDTNCAASTQYYYQVRANNAAGDSAYSNEANATTQAPAPTAPPAPSGLAATAVSSTQINLAWTDNASNETGFKIERKTGAAGVYAQIGTALTNAVSYQDSGLTAGTQYFYHVRASNSAGDSAFSNEANATTQAAPATPPAAPSTLAATAASSAQIDLAWTDNSNNETGFKIERKTGAAGVYAQIATPTVNAVSYSDTGLSAGTQYFYRIRATNTAGDSGYSNEANATTQQDSPSPAPPPPPTPPIVPPAITSGAVPSSPTATPGQPVTFSVAAGGSNGATLTYIWNFGDGTTGSGASVPHTYSAPGSYSVVVTIDDGHGGIATSSTGITVNVSIKINFQPADSPVPNGYFADSGAIYDDRGNGYSYGWNADTASASRDRNSSASPDQRYDTFIHMQKPGNPNAVWEIGLPNGTYQVRVVSGDPSFFDSVYGINAEGVITVNATPAGTTRWAEGTGIVPVADGKLTLSNAPGSINNKICFVEITSIGLAAARDYEAAVADEIVFNSMTLSQLHGGMDFTKTKHDSVSFKAELTDLEKDFKPAGARVAIDVGSAMLNFTLDKTGKAKGSNGACRIAFSRATGHWTIQISCKGGTWTPDWADGGVDSSVKTATTTIPVTVTVNGRIFGGGKLVKYAGNGKTGKMK